MWQAVVNEHTGRRRMSGHGSDDEEHGSDDAADQTTNDEFETCIQAAIGERGG